MKINLFGAIILCALGTIMLTTPGQAASAYQLNRDSRQALRQLFAQNPKAAAIANESSAMLVFPKVIKAGFIFGAQGGEGVLIRSGVTVGYYQTSSVSYGLQAGVQDFSYVLFFMNPQALAYLRNSNGWEIGVGPSIVVVDSGVARTLSSTTLQKDIYAFIFNQQGLMAGLGLQGTKITQYTPSQW